MALPAEKLVVCPVLVGRARYLAALRPVVEGVIAGTGRVVAVSGEAGLGKSRLVAEAKQRIGDELRIMQGHCFEPDRSLPYAPFLDLMRSCIATHEPREMIDCLGTDAADLAKLLPELTAIIPGLTPAPTGDPEQERRRIVHAMCQFFTRVAAKQPLMLVIEDMHWSDETSLELLAQLARRMTAAPMLVVITFRSDEVQPALRQTLASLNRQHVLLEWPLERLDTADVERMMQAIFELDTPIRSEFLGAIYTLTEGNPFFIEEVLKALVAAGDIFYVEGTWDRKPIDELQIPQSSHAAVAARTAHLSEAAQRTLVIAAVAGRRFDFDLLQMMTSLDEHELLAIIKELVSAQLVVEESADHFGFRHALTQQAIYSDLLARERRALHRDIAASLRQLAKPNVDVRLSDLAHHFYEAESWDEAFYYCRKLAEGAQTMSSSSAAILQFSRAIEAAGHLGVDVPASMYRSRGQAYEAHGDFDDALADFERTLDMATVARDGRAEWQALIDLGFLWSGRDYSKSGGFFRRASERAAQIGDEVLEARSLNRLGNWLVNTGDTGEGVALHERALAMFRSHGDEGGEIETQDLVGMAYGLNNDPRRGVEALSAAIDALRPAGAGFVICSSLGTRATWSAPNLCEVSYAPRRTLKEALQDADDARAMAQQLDSPAALSYAEWIAGGVLDGYGRPYDGLARARAGLRLAEDIGHVQWVSGSRFTLGRIWFSMLALEDAIAELTAGADLARDVGSTWWLGNCSSYLAFAYLARDETDAAEAVLASTWPMAHEPRALAEKRVLWAWGRLALERERWADACAVADRLIATAPQTDRPEPIPCLLQLRGEALLGMRRDEEAVADLVAARDGAIKRDSPGYLWPIHRALARAYQAQRRTIEAEAENAATRRVIASMAANIGDEAIRTQFEGRALATLPQLRVPTPNRIAKEAFGGLTAREREVAALVSRGKSNRDIAEELVLGERTIETHVGNVLSKLGFSSRAQIAAWAVEIGLTKTH